MNTRWQTSRGAVFALLLACSEAAPLPASQLAFGPLTNAAQVRALSVSEAAARRPIRLTGIVTAFNPPVSVFLQDSTGGTFLTDIKGNFPQLSPGDVVSVQGVSHVGLFMPGIREATVHILGQAELPPAIPVTYDDLLSARHHYERVEVEGIVRAVRWQPSRSCPMLTLAVGSRKLDVEVVVPAVTNLPPLVDAKLRVKALAGGYINLRRQLRSPELLVSRMEDLSIEVAPPDDPFAGPFVRSTALLNFKPEGEAGHRARVRGTVLYHHQGESLFLRNGPEGLLVRTVQEVSFPDAQPEIIARPGDIVEVAGFPAMGQFSACLEDAVFRVVDREDPPEPRISSITEVMQGTNDADLVTIKGKLLDIIPSAAETVLVVGDGNTFFRARIVQPPQHLRAGSAVQLTGVCVIKQASGDSTRFRSSPLEMEMLLRTRRDIEVLSEPSGWTPQRFATVIGILMAVALVAFGWVMLLRRRVAEQSRIIRAKIQREAILEERHRMAREMHDTLAQSFSGLGFQLDALRTRLPENAEHARAQLEVARQMVQYGQEDFRRSLLNLRAQELERGTLAEALSDLARQITAGTKIQLHCYANCSRRLPELVETNLLRIGQECLTNSVRHACAKSIFLELSDHLGEIRLRIADDGIGFDPKTLSLSEHGHFGWRGIRERAGQIGAEIVLDSKPGSGTEIIITVTQAYDAA